MSEKDKDPVQPCPECNGRKTIVKLNAKEAKKEDVRCPTCLGSGYNNPKQLDGVARAINNTGKVIYYVYRKSGKTIASILSVVSAEPLSESLIITKKDSKPYKLVGQLFKMNTDKKHQNKGYMSCCLQVFQAEVDEIKTSWSDSSKRGRNFCLKHGFKKEIDQSDGEEKLIWRRPEEVKDEKSKAKD